MDTRTIDLSVLNTATKYPSILTYHAMGEKGRLSDARTVEPVTNLIVTEKVDGTNTRLIFMPDGRYLIGSREQLLHASGDIVANPALGIVDSIRPMADRLNDLINRKDDEITVAFLETFGGKTTAASKNYTSKLEFGHRLFDVCKVTVDQLDGRLEELSLWRENGGQAFFGEDELQDFSDVMSVPLTERLETEELPTDHAGVMSWLEQSLPETKVRLDPDANGVPEGVVVRSYDRKSIAKIRFVDYRRTLKGRN